MIVTDDDAFAERLRRLRHQGMSLSDHARHGARPTVFEDYPEIGYNFRITDIQAAIGLASSTGCPRSCAPPRIASVTTTICVTIRSLSPPYVPEGMEHNWQSYMIGLRPGTRLTRNGAMDWLYDRGVPTRRGVMASHLEPPYAAMNAALPHTEFAAENSLQLPMHPGLTRAQQDHVIASLEELYCSRQGVTRDEAPSDIAPPMMPDTASARLSAA